jgi:hypothetical protein
MVLHKLAFATADVALIHSGLTVQMTENTTVANSNPAER